ncbi:MAG: translation initiation factor IF-2 N-terminal domain-containing protein, partial [Candidatus Buchananbacteria bacterium]|nr:translation initiation factor IF-2 N-terminal domain-containing protein [Candidatus Buchananbacteria bacterium]
MNVTELARQLKVTTTELFDKLPGMGFDIGRRAIKVDNQIALKIIDAWKRAAREEREKSRMAAIRGTGAGDETEAGPVAMLEVRLPAVTTVRELSQLTGVPVNKLLGTLLKNGVLTSMNERIDFDTVSIIAEELGFKVVPDEQQVVTTDVATAAQDNLKQILADSTSEIQRPPVIVVMGHVDHGKTKILDTIR